MTLAVILAGGHGSGLLRFVATQLGPRPESWDWRKFGRTAVVALVLWGLAVWSGHAVEDVATQLDQVFGLGFLVVIADQVVNVAIKWWTTGDPRPTAPSSGGGSA